MATPEWSGRGKCEVNVMKGIEQVPNADNNGAWRKAVHTQVHTRDLLGWVSYCKDAAACPTD
jgi:hypothetical protein